MWKKTEGHFTGNIKLHLRINDREIEAGDFSLKNVTP